MSIDAINTSPDFDEVWSDAVGSDVDIVATYGDFARKIRAGVGGTLVVVNSKGRTVTIHNLQPGEPVTGAIGRLVASGSTAYQILVHL